ncbi:MAG: hypothetical protein V1676_05980 [Candidatus Diapherotrites archaeon]
MRRRIQKEAYARTLRYLSGLSKGHPASELRGLWKDAEPKLLPKVEPKKGTYSVREAAEESGFKIQPLRNKINRGELGLKTVERGRIVIDGQQMERLLAHKNAVSAQDAAGMLGITRASMAQLCEQGKINGAVKKGGQWRVPNWAINNLFLEMRRIVPFEYAFDVLKGEGATNMHIESVRKICKRHGWVRDFLGAQCISVPDFQRLRLRLSKGRVVPKHVEGAKREFLKNIGITPKMRGYNELMETGMERLKENAQCILRALGAGITDLSRFSRNLQLPLGEENKRAIRQKARAVREHEELKRTPVSREVLGRIGSQTYEGLPLEDKKGLIVSAARGDIKAKEKLLEVYAPLNRIISGKHIPGAMNVTFAAKMHYGRIGILNALKYARNFKNIDGYFAKFIKGSIRNEVAKDQRKKKNLNFDDGFDRNLRKARGKRA